MTFPRAIYIGPDKILTPTLVKDKILIKGTKMVNRIKESPLTTWAAPVLLTLVLGYNIYDSQRVTSIMSAQAVQIQQLHDDMIRLQAKKEEQDKIDERDRQERFQLAREDSIWREQISKQMARWELIIQGKYPRSENSNNEKEN